MIKYYIFKIRGGCTVKKTVKWIVIAIILVIVIGIGILVVKDFQQEEILREEMLAFENLTRAETIDVDQIDQRIRELKTTGDYGVVEKAVKEYLADGLNASIEISNVLNDERITNALTPENYTEDGPDFVQTKQFLEESKGKLEEYKTKFLELLSDDAIMSYIEGKNLDQYYIDLYKELALSADNSSESEKQEFESDMNQIIETLDLEIQIINFLSENKGNWEIQGENIVFNSEELQNQYDEYVSQIQ